MATNCRFLLNNSIESEGDQGNVAILEITTKNRPPRRITIDKTQDILMNFGDKIKSISGTVVIMINPGMASGLFILSPKIPKNADWKHRTELEINKVTTSVIQRGEIRVSEDIGTVLTSTGATTR